MQVVGFVIHLARAVQRREHVAALQRLSSVPLAVIDAVDGTKLSEAEIAAVYASEGLLQPRYPFDISKGEIGCFLSHRKAWQAIVDSGADAGLVFEDDAVVDAEVPWIRRASEGHPWERVFETRTRSFRVSPLPIARGLSRLPG